MEIKKTYIAYHKELDCYVKVHLCENSKYDKKYYIEFEDGTLQHITASNFIELID